ncbi:MAG: oxidoreductase [Chloroflexota bacterium]|nr:MAG: oxidoreductase [Chloroflexota bacterium]
MGQSLIKVGVVGAGIGRHHLAAYRALPQAVEIVALCDVNEARLNEIGTMYNVPRYFTDYNELFVSGEIEAVSVCLPNSLHAPVSIAALEAGLHVLCEKPLAENLASSYKIAEAVARAPGKFMICFNRRYRLDVQWMKQVLRQGLLGRIYQIKAGWVRETGIPGWGGWFLNKTIAGGGPLIDLGVHMLDAVLWLLDYPEPLTVSGVVEANFGPRQAKTWQAPTPPLPYTVEDSATAFIRLAGDVALSLDTSWASHAKPGMDDFFITLMGTEGSIELYVANYATENTLTLYTEIGGKPSVIRPAVKLTRSDHEYAITEFVRCIQEDSVPTATVEQGLTLMKIIEAIYQSAEAKREVILTQSGRA